MSVLDIYRELKDVEPYLLTRREYAALVKAASQKVIKKYILLRKQARRDLDAWAIVNPGPERPASYASNKEHERYQDQYKSYQQAWGHKYQKLYNLSTHVNQLKRNIILANVIENNRIESCQNDSRFWMFFGGVNNPLLTQGQKVFTALLQNIDVPEHVLAEWPEGVAQVQQEIALRAAQDKIN